MEDITVLIRTINRPTLIHSITSALKNFKKVIVVADDVDLDLKSLPTQPVYLRTGKKFDKYGSACINMGAYACDTEYFCLLDDDDEFLPDAGKFMKSKVSSDKSIDIWVPGLLYSKESSVACMNPSAGVTPGNIAVPTYRTELLFELPFSAELKSRIPNQDLIDFFHVYALYKQGHKVNWYQKLLYNIRPKLPGMNGRGSV